MLDLLTKAGAYPSHVGLSKKSPDMKAAYTVVNKTSRQKGPIESFLFESILQNNLDRFQRGVLMGENVNQRDSENRTPLHLCILNLRETPMMILLKQSASVNAQDQHGHAPLHYIARLAD